MEYQNFGQTCSFSICFSFQQFKENELMKSIDGVLGIRIWAAEWKEQTNPLSYGAPICAGYQVNGQLDRIEIMITLVIFRPNLFLIIFNCRKVVVRR